MAILVETEAIWNGLFHDPKERKNPSGHSKDYWHMRLAEEIFRQRPEWLKLKTLYYLLIST